MAFLTAEEKLALATQIRTAEKQTSAEIVTVIADQSDHYRYIPMLWAALIALAVPGIYYLFQHINNNGWAYPGNSVETLARLYYVQVLVFLGLGMLIQYRPFRLWLVPKSVKHGRAARHAREQFLLQNLHQTQTRTGVMVFVSVAEHYVEIIVDSEVAAVVDNDVWVETVNEFTSCIKRGAIHEGFNRTIEHCSEVLSKHFPENGDKPDELPNNLIEIVLE
jgi:putative membrane protein